MYHKDLHPLQRCTPRTCTLCRALIGVPQGLASFAELSDGCTRKSCCGVLCPFERPLKSAAQPVAGIRGDLLPQLVVTEDLKVVLSKVCVENITVQLCGTGLEAGVGKNAHMTNLTFVCKDSCGFLKVVLSKVCVEGIAVQLCSTGLEAGVGKMPI